MTDPAPNEEPWPPASGVPTKGRMIPADALEFGMTAFDGLSRAELLRLVQAYHSALSSARTALRLCRDVHVPGHPLWGETAPGGVALAKTAHLMELSGADDDRGAGRGRIAASSATPIPCCSAAPSRREDTMSGASTRTV